MTTLRVRPVKNNSQTWEYEIRRNDRTLKYQGGFETEKNAQDTGVLEYVELERNRRKKYFTLPILFRYWIIMQKENQGFEPATIYDYHKQEKLFEKKLGGDISKITLSKYQLFINELSKTNAKKRVNRLNNSISNALRFAIHDHLITLDDYFVEGVTIPIKGTVNKKTQKKFIASETEVIKFREALRAEMDFSHTGMVKDTYTYIIYFLLQTGMRYSELIALTPSDIDFEKKVIKTYRRYSTEKHTFSKAKTEGSKRDVPLIDEDIAILKHLIASQKYENDIINNTTFLNENKYGFIFWTIIVNHGLPTTAQVTKQLQVKLKKYDIKPYNLTVYGLRHTVASLWLSKGIPIEVVAVNLGNTPETLRSVYRHLFDEEKSIGQDKIREMMK